MRMFLGIPLASQAAGRLTRLQQRLSGLSDGLRWSRPESRHLTLQFLGNVEERQLACLLVRLAEVHSPPVRVHVEDVGFFHHANILLARVSPTPELLTLEKRVTAATRLCGFEPENRPYTPHITLARGKGRHGGRTLAPVQDALRRAESSGENEIACSFTAEELLLYESILSPQGSRYEVRARFPLLDR
jgi:2'-5' RNA ligase